MWAHVALLGALLVWGSGCDRRAAQLERDLAAAREHADHVTRVASRREGMTSATRQQRIDAIERRLPEPRLRAFTATVAAVAADLGARLSTRAEAETHGAVLTEPVVVELSADRGGSADAASDRGGSADAASDRARLADATSDRVRLADATSDRARLAELIRRLEGVTLPWLFDGYEHTQAGLRVALHGFAAAPSALSGTSTAALAPGPDDGHGGRDALRRQIRAELRRATTSTTVRQAIVAQRKEAVLADLDRRMTVRSRDTAALLAVLEGVDQLPRGVSFIVRRGRRLCTIALSSEFERVRLTAESLRQGLAVDAKRTELVLPSGRTCALIDSGEDPRGSPRSN